MIGANKGPKENLMKPQRVDMTVEVVYGRIVSHWTPNSGLDDQPQQPAAFDRWRARALARQ